MIIFDVDGVLSSATIPMDMSGEPIRTVNIKDGYAIQLANKMGLRIAILTGGNNASIVGRYSRLGVKDIYMNCAIKLNDYEKLLSLYGISDEEVLYMGDDIPDYEVMMRCGCPCSPADACAEIKDISIYISDKKGGKGCARDVIEQVLRTQNKWMSDRKAFGW